MKHTVLHHLFAFSLCLQAALAQSENEPFIVPFELVGNTIIVEATLDGTTGHFILDTGSPVLILNSNYFSGVNVSWLKLSVADFHGELSKAKHYLVSEMSVAEMPVPTSVALVLDLENLEKSKGMPLHGIIGYDSFHEVEMMLDFEKRHAVFFPTDKKGARLCGTTNYQLADSLDMKMSGHFPYIMAELYGKKLRLGIDTGAEANIIQPAVMKNKIAEIELTHNIEVRGIKNERKICPRGWIKSLRFGHWDLENQEMAITDLDGLNGYLTVRLDGILGTPFLKERKLAFNYRSRKIYLWEDAIGEVANKSEMAKIEANKAMAREKR